MKVNVEGVPLKENPEEIVVNKDISLILNVKGSFVELVGEEGEFYFNSFEDLENTYKAFKLAVEEYKWLKKPEVVVNNVQKGEEDSE